MTRETITKRAPSYSFISFRSQEGQEQEREQTMKEPGYHLSNIANIHLIRPAHVNEGKIKTNRSWKLILKAEQIDLIPISWLC